MGRYVVRQLLQRIPLIVGITLVVFALVHLTPGSPIDELRLNPDIKPADLASLEKTLGIDKPLPEQYLTWISQVVRGDLGISLKNYRPVRSLIFQRLGNTLLLTGCALLLTLLIAIPVGVLSALRRNSLFDYIAVVCTTLADAIPSFWLGLLLILIFSVQFKQWGLPWMPSGGVQTLPNGGDFFDRAKHLIMPTVTLSMLETARWVRYTRGQMLEVLNQDYVRTARAKGIAENIVIMGHAFRNATLPLITLVGLSIPSLFAGAVIIERIFSWPGIGSLAIDSATNRDYTTIMGVTLFISVITVFSSLLADIFYGVADPRVTYS